MPRTKAKEVIADKVKESPKVSRVRGKKGLKIERYFTIEGENPLDKVGYETRSCYI